MWCSFPSAAERRCTGVAAVLGEVFRKLAVQKESRIEEGHLLPDHVAHDDRDIAEVCGVAGDWVHQGESAIYLARVYGERKRNSRASISGRAGTMCPRWGRMRR